jgi:ADP-dependent NAD(P)H-hydrate dehydratase / NAD(P)H-hydrate epimerase
MIPVLTPEEMAAVDRAAPEPTEVLVRRAAGEVARAAVLSLGGTYGRRVVVVAGPGNNGADGRVAAELLRRRGVRVTVVDAKDAPEVLPSADLVIDAAFGTGFRGTYEFPDPSGAPVLAVDIPSGVDGLTGRAAGRPARAVRTVTFAAVKPGLLLADGPDHAGEVTVADIGLDVSGARAHLVDDPDVPAWVPSRAGSAHKWRHAVRIVAGSPGMSGAAHLCAAGALRGGAGYVQLSSPGDPSDVQRGDQPPPLEVVGVPLDPRAWASEVIGGSGRFAAVAIGPGLGRSDDTVREVRAAVAAVPRPLVVDGDALWALGTDAPFLLRDRPGPTVLTPHDGEFERLTGRGPGDDRVDSARTLAAACRSTVLLKGPTTVVSDPDGTVLFVRAGDERLATAGTGDVLTGLVVAHLALGADTTRAAASAAHLHGRSAELGRSRGFTASDLPDLVAVAWERLAAGRPPRA